MPILLDTNVLIRFFGGDEPLAEMIECAESVIVHPVVYAEFVSGIHPTTAGGKVLRQKLEAFLDEPVVTQCELSATTALHYAKIYRYLKSRGQMIPQNDIWIAASALEHGWEVYTHDRHFEHIPLLQLMVEG